MRLSTAQTKYRTQKAKARNRGIPFYLTYEQWYNWWLSQGVNKETHHSNSTDGLALCMCRYNDQGAYELGNIYCTTRSENSRDARKVDPRAGRSGAKRAVKTPLGIFESTKAAAIAHNCTDVTIRNRLSTGIYPQPGYEYTDEDYKISQTIQTPLGLFQSLSDAAVAHNVHKSTIMRRCKNQPREYYYV